MSTCLCSGAGGAVAKRNAIAPAKHGGGFDLTCKRSSGEFAGALAALSRAHAGNVYARRRRRCGHYNAIVAQRHSEPGTVVAQHCGVSLLGNAREILVATAWMMCALAGSVGTDCGMIAVCVPVPRGKR